MQHTTAAHVHLHNTHSYRMKWNEKQTNTDGNSRKTLSVQLNQATLYFNDIEKHDYPFFLNTFLHTYKLSNSKCVEADYISKH